MIFFDNVATVKIFHSILALKKSFEYHFEIIYKKRESYDTKRLKFFLISFNDVSVDC